MLLTNDQRYLLSLLRETGYMRRTQILPLMRLYNPAKAEPHCEAILRHLRYAGELIPVGEDLVCLAELRERGPDEEMLRAVDILLALATGSPLQIAGRKPPYKLCFLLERGDGRIDPFGVMPVEPGREQLACILLAREADEEGFHDLADRFRMVGAIEKRHEERYRKLLNDVQMKQVFEKSGQAMWECRVCGHIVVGTKAPEVCPVCKYSQAYFEVHKI